MSAGWKRVLAGLPPHPSQRGRSIGSASGWDEAQRPETSCVTDLPSFCPLRYSARMPRWTTENRHLIDTAKPAISAGARDCGVLLRGLLRAQVGVDFGAPAS